MLAPGPPALSPAGLIDLKGPSTHCVRLMHIQLSTQTVFTEPLQRARHCLMCWGKSSELDKAPASLTNMVATDKPVTHEACGTTLSGDVCQEVASRTGEPS